MSAASDLAAVEQCGQDAFATRKFPVLALRCAREGIGTWPLTESFMEKLLLEQVLKSTKGRTSFTAFQSFTPQRPGVVKNCHASIRNCHRLGQKPCGFSKSSSGNKIRPFVNGSFLRVTFNKESHEQREQKNLFIFNLEVL